MAKGDLGDNLIEKLKKLFSGNVDVTEEDRKKSQTLIDTLKQLETEYNKRYEIDTESYVNDVIEPQLTEKKYVQKSDAEIAREAETELLPGFTQKSDMADQTLQSKLNALDEKGAEAESKKARDEATLNAQMKKLTDQQQQSVIRQKIVHSSINEGGKDEIETYGAVSAENIKSDFDDKFNAIKSERERAMLSYENALKEYNLKYAADLEKKIAGLKLQEEKRLEEINKYNKKIAAEKEAYRKNVEAKRKEQDEAAAVLEEMRKETESFSRELYGPSQAEKEELEKRYRMAYDFYSAFDKDVAAKLIADSVKELETLLGDENYLKLYAAIEGEK